MALGQYFVRSTEADASSAAFLTGEDEIWREADRIIWGPAAYRTSFRALWTPETLGGLHLRFDVIDPDPWHTMEKRDDPLWDEEVVEIFLDLDGSGTHYAEVELNPANVTCDVRMIQGSPDKKMDLAWELVGLSTRVFRREDGWSGLLFLPWTGLRSLPSSWTIALPPEKGDRWRFNLYRIERPGGSAAPNENVTFSAYSPTGSPSFHVPASFQGFVFA